MDDQPETTPVEPQDPAHASLNGSGVFGAMDEPDQGERPQMARDVKLIGHALREQEIRIRSIQAVTLVLLVAALVVVLELELIRRKGNS